MLVVLYGLISHMGKKCRDYFLKERGFQFVEKLNYIEGHSALSVSYGNRNLVSKQEFYDHTDSLFRYQLGGLHVGFNQKQIDEAVYGEGNSLMTLSTGDIGFLGNIKQVYGDKVCLIYAYIDDVTLNAIVESGDYTPEEAATRLDIGRQVKEGYLRHRDIFDHVVMYGGEDSLFNIQSLYNGFSLILEQCDKKEKQPLRYGDVFIACDPADDGVDSRLYGRLTQKGVSVFDNRQLSYDEEYEMQAADAIRHAKFFLPILSERALENGERMMNSLFAVAANNGCLIVPLLLERTYSDVENLLENREEITADFYEMTDYQDDDTIADMAYDLKELIDYEAEISACACKAEEYRRHNLKEAALYWQKKHCKLCRDIRDNDVNRLKETYIGGRDVAAESAAKVVRLLLEMRNFAQAEEWLRHAIEFDSGFYADDTADVLIEEVLHYCAYMGMDGERAYAYLSDLFFSDYTEEQKAIFGWEEAWLEEWMICYGELLEKWADTVKVTSTAPAAAVGKEQERIAQHGEDVLSLFADILKNNGENLARADLVEGYQRILNYCTHMGVRGAVLNECIDRLNELKAQSGAVTGDLTRENRALKMYLGDRTADDGEYDVFLSFKSEDAAMASTVYDFLTRNGKKVFFSKETLPMLGESEYKDAIYEALDHSKNMVVVASDPDYLKTPWVKREWDTFDSELLEGRKTGEIFLVLADDIVGDKSKFPTALRTREIVKMSEFRQRLLTCIK